MSDAGDAEVTVAVKVGYTGFGESTALSVFFWISALGSVFFLIFTIRKSKYRLVIRDQTVLFWAFISIWQMYRGAISVHDFSSATVDRTYRVMYSSLNHLLMFIPMCLVILILFELLFTYRNPGSNAITFFRALYLLFMFTFLVLGIVLSVVDMKSEENIGDSIVLWCACSDLILSIFFALPAHSLLEAVTYPMVQPEDVCCVNACKVGIILFLLLFGGRTLWNGTHYYGVNRLQSEVDAWVNDQKMPDGRARTFHFFWFLVFDFGTSTLAMISVYLFKRHDLMFNENPYYTRQSE